MKNVAIALTPAVCLLLAAAPGCAEEAIRTGDGGAPPVVNAPTARAATAMQADPQGTAEWGRRILSGAPAEPDAKASPASRCDAPVEADNKPHGEVWGAVGSHGYRQVGGVLTQPLGACGSLTVMIDHTEGGYYGPVPPRNLR